MTSENFSGVLPSDTKLDALLLDAKLSIPPPRRGSVSRAPLIETARSSERRVVGVTAPAGYGKSTLLTEWAHSEDRPVAWVSLDQLDDDPATLVTMLASAYVRASGSESDLVANVGGAGSSVLARAAPRLATAFSTSPSPFVLMMDDLHSLQSPNCHDVLSVVISGIPPGSQLVATSRSEQPHLPKLRATGDAIEFSATDLALDEAGARQIFNEARVAITSELAAAVTQRTEGWPVGMYLAAMIAMEGKGEQLTISGDDRYVADYLYKEALMRLSEDTQRFLRRTAVVDQLSGPLCDAVLGEPGGQEHLRELEASSSFLVPLDRRREWYRYHALFREFLLAELRRIEPDMIMNLHLRAADWYESNESPALALEHLLQTTERDRSMQALTALFLPTYQAGQMSTVQRWLSTIGDDAIEGYPPLAVAACWMAALDGQTTAAERWLARVETASFDGTLPDGSASFESARAMLRALMCPAGPDQAVADADLAVGVEPAWSPWRDTALGVAGEAYLLAGDVDRAVELFMEAIEAPAGQASTDNVVVSQSELALLAMDRGAWSEAEEQLEPALAAIDDLQMQDYPVCLIAFAGAARLAMHRGDLKEANRRLTQAMRARPSSTYALPGLAVGLRLQLAQVYLTLADRTTARHLLREIDDVLVHRPDLGVLVDRVSAFRDLLASSAQIGATGSSPLSPAELRLLPYLQTHLTIAEIAERLFVSRNTASSEVSSIYRKLGVSSRNEAVEQSTMLGLLGG